jgi:hypothetical protein
MKKFISLIVLLALSSTLLAQTVPLTATNRIQNMANEEAAWRYASGGGKVVFGGVLLGTGIAMWQSAGQNIFTVLALVPLSIIIGAPGAVIMGWGAADLLFGSREYENQNGKLKLASEVDRENQATLYLKDKSEKDKQSRQPSFWNAFGLFSMFETPAEREYKAYLKDRSQF